MSKLTETVEELERAHEELGDRTSALGAANVQIDALGVSLRLLEQRNVSLQAERTQMTETIKVWWARGPFAVTRGGGDMVASLFAS